MDWLAQAGGRRWLMQDDARRRSEGFIAMLLFVILAFPCAIQAQSGARTATYFCPMHPAITSVAKGRCPECGMALEALGRGLPLVTESRRTLRNHRGAPLYSRSVDGQRISVWISALPPLAGAMDSSEASHTVRVAVLDDATRSGLDSMDVWFHIVYPNGRNLMPRLERREGAYTGNVRLDQRGMYTFMVHANSDDSRSVIFRYRRK